MPKGLKKLTLKTINDAIRKTGQQPKFNGMAPKGPKRKLGKQPARADPSENDPRAPPGPREPVLKPGALGAAGIGTAAAAGVSLTGLALTGGAGLRSSKVAMKRRGPDGPFAESGPVQGVPKGWSPGGNPQKMPQSSGFSSPAYAPVAVGVTKHGSSPKMWAKANKGNVSVTVEHTEYVRDLTGTSGFTPTGLNINPGNSEVFGWLSDLAGLFEEYHFDKLEFSYNPSVGTDTDGKLLMIFDPDVKDELPDTKQQMLESRVQIDSTPWQPMTFRVPKDLLESERYTRMGAVPADTDPHFYDVGQLIYATPGVPTSVCGELFVSYRVVFSTPNGAAPRAGSLYATTAIGGTTVAAPLGTAAPAAEYNPGQFRPTWLSGTTFTLPAIGDFRVSMYHAGSAFSAPGGLAAAGDNTVAASTSAFSATSAIEEWNVKVLDPTDIFTVTSPASAATLTQTRIHVYAWDEDWF